MSSLTIRKSLRLLDGSISFIHDLLGKEPIREALSVRQALEQARSFDRFFLDEVASDDAFFRGPRRTSCVVEPLIDRARALRAMERPIMEAQSTVFLAGWLFFPNTPLQDPGVRKKIKGRTWLNLIRFVLEKEEAKVKVRIILTDFDPFFATVKHRLCWSAMSQLAKMQQRLLSDRRENLEFLGSLHGFFINPGILKIFKFFISGSDPIKSQVDGYNKLVFSKALKLYRNTPGHWESIGVNVPKKRFSIRASPETRAFIASHHQKFCVIDGRIAFCGGMDITPSALDTMDHKLRRRDVSWHDIHSLIKGQVVTDIERGFRERWNVEKSHFEGRVRVMRHGDAS